MGHQIIACCYHFPLHRPHCILHRLSRLYSTKLINESVFIEMFSEFSGLQGIPKIWPIVSYSKDVLKKVRHIGSTILNFIELTSDLDSAILKICIKSIVLRFENLNRIMLNNFFRLCPYMCHWSKSDFFLSIYFCHWQFKLQWLGYAIFPYILSFKHCKDTFCDLELFSIIVFKFLLCAHNTNSSNFIEENPRESSGSEFNPSVFEPFWTNLENVLNLYWYKSVEN